MRHPRGTPPTLNHLTAALRQGVKRKLDDEHEKEWPQAKFGGAYRKIQPTVDKRPLEKHRNLKRWESSIIVQLRTAHISLGKYLHRIGHADTPMCACNTSQEDPSHVLFQCPLYQDLRNTYLWKDVEKTTSLELTTSEPQRCRNAARFMVETKRLTSFAWVSHEAAGA